MPIEEDTLAILEEGRLASVQTEEARQARYAAEDEARGATRANEDRLVAEGDKVREDRVAEMNDRIKARGVSAEAQISEQNVRISNLEALLAAKVGALEPQPLEVHKPDPYIPVDRGDEPIAQTGTAEPSPA